MSGDTPFFKPGDPVCDALFSGQKALRNRDKQYTEGPIEFLPGHFSNDWPFLKFKEELSLKLTKAFPETVDDFGRVSGNGVRSNFFGVRHVNGFPMRPSSFPLTDNRYLREKAGLSNSFVEPWHKVALQAIVELFFADLQPVALKLRKGSSSMMPYYETKMEPRKEIARHSLRNAAKAGDLFGKGDFETPWRQFQIGGAYHTVYRRQSSDAITKHGNDYHAKPRPVADFDYAISGGRRGTFLPASKELGDVDFRVPPGFFRERNRTAAGGPFGLNAALMPLAQSCRLHIYQEYAYTFHHTTRESMQQSLRDWAFSIAVDVSSHDMYWPTFILDTVADSMGNVGISDWWRQLYLAKSRLPLYVTDVDVGKGNVLFGDWRKPNLHSGLPSGNALTDIEGTIVMTWVYLMVQVEHTFPSGVNQLKELSSAKVFIDRYLKGTLPIKLKDKSDDGLLGWSDPTLVVQARKLLDRMKAKESISPYMSISYEHGGAFLGNILLYPETKEFKGVVLIGNVNSLVINQFSPEYGVSSSVKDRSRTKRPFPGLAWETYSQAYGSSPVYGGVMEIVEECWFNHYHESYRGYRDALLLSDKAALEKYIKEQGLKMDSVNLSPVDHEVLADPSKLQYKYVPEDVSPAVLEMLFQGLGLEETEPYFRSIYA